MKKIDVYETENARRYRVSEFPFLNLINARRALINEGYLDRYSSALDLVRVTSEDNDRIIIYVKSKDRAASCATLSGSIIMDRLRIWEVYPDGEQ